MKILFHCHTVNSTCSNIQESELIDFLNMNSYDAVVVADHNHLTRIDWPNGLVIPSSEISTSEGDMIGIFLKKNVPKGSSIQETCKMIHSQGGLAIAAHPCDTVRKEAMGAETLTRNLGWIDAIEVFNSRNIFNKANNQAGRIANSNNIPGVSGADAHTTKELPNAYMIMQRCSNPKEFLESLKTALSKKRVSGPLPHVKTYFIKRSGQRRLHPE